MTRAATELPEEWVLPLSWSKKTPGVRCICQTMTRSVPLMMNVPLARHQGHVAHIDVLLLDVADRARAAVLVDVPDDQAQGHLQRRAKGHAALLALVDVVFRLLQLIAHKFELGPVREIADRETDLKTSCSHIAGSPVARHCRKWS